MEKEILTALVEMVKQGGTLAIIGIGVYWLMAILKLAVHGGILWVVCRLACSTIVRCLELRLDKRNSTISLLSKECATSICTTLDSIAKEQQAILKDIDEELRALKTQSNGNQEKKSKSKGSV